MPNLRAVISTDVLLPQLGGVSGLGVVHLASLNHPMQDLYANAAFLSSYAPPSPPMPGYVPSTISHGRMSGVSPMTRLGVAESMGEERS